MQVERTFAVQNNSKPPRTQMNEHNLEFFVPDGAKVTDGQAMTAGGQPVNSAPVPEGENAKNKYAFLFPLRPGRRVSASSTRCPTPEASTSIPRAFIRSSISSRSLLRQYNSPARPGRIFRSLLIPDSPTPT